MYYYDSKKLTLKKISKYKKNGKYSSFNELKSIWCFFINSCRSVTFSGNLLNWGSERLNHSAFRKKDSVTSCTQIHDFQHIGVKKKERAKKEIINVL